MVAEVKKANHQASASKRMKTGHLGYQATRQPDDQTTKRVLTKVEESDIVPFEDPRMQFAEQARALRERGNRVIQRVSVNSITPDNYQLYEL